MATDFSTFKDKVDQRQRLYLNISKKTLETVGKVKWTYFAYKPVREKEVKWVLANKVIWASYTIFG